MMTRRILIFDVNWLGDVLFSTAAIRNVKRNFPDSYIACIIPSRCYPVLKDNPHLDEIIIFDEKDRHKSLFAKLKFISFLKSRKFDTVFLLHRSFSRALICYLAGIPLRVGYYTKKRWFLLNKNIPASNLNSLHRIDYYLNIIEKSGLKVEDRYTEFFIKEEDRQFADNFLNKNSVKKDDFLIAINPGGNWLPKRWTRSNWALLADRLTIDFSAKVIITGNHIDLSLAEDIKRMMQAKPIIACGLLNLKQFAALCKRIDLFITADSGPLHIANAVGTKQIIALFGPTSIEITGPFPLKNTIIIKKDISCKIPCYKQHCRDNRCMKAITAEEVIKEIKKIIV